MRPKGDEKKTRMGVFLVDPGYGYGPVMIPVEADPDQRIRRGW